MHNYFLVYTMITLGILGFLGVTGFIIFLILNKEKELNTIVMLWMLLGFISCVFYGFMYNSFTNPQYFNCFIKFNFTDPLFLAFVITWNWRATVFFFFYAIIFRNILKKYKMKSSNNKQKIFPVMFILISTISLVWITDFEKLAINGGSLNFQHFLNWFGGITGCITMFLFVYVFLGDKIIKYLEIRESFQNIKNKFLYVFLIIVLILLLDIFGLLIGCLGVDSYFLLLFKIAIYCILYLIPLMMIILKITKEFSYNLQESVNFLKYTANQDLTKNIEIKSNDEFMILGDSLLLLKNNLKEIIGVVDNSSKEVKNSAGKLNEFLTNLISSISSFFDLLKKNSEIQKNSSVTAEKHINETFNKLNIIYSDIQILSSYVDDSSRSVVKMSEIINNISEKTKEASHISQNLFKIANEGDQTIEKSLSSIKEIETSSNKINDIITIIDDISNRIKILAINAAIESTNAGESGKGFSIISREMRALAENTTNNAHMIASLLKEILSKISNALILFGQSKDYFSNIHSLVNQSKIINQDINDSMEEEKKETRELLSVTDGLVRITNEIKDSSEYLTQANEVIKDVFIELKGITENENESIITNSSQVEALIDMLNKLTRENLIIADKLNTMIGKFKMS